MAICVRCKRSVRDSALRCPHCNATLKAYGHPGITLHQSEGDTFLCDRCRYHEDDTCNLPQRPYSNECTLFRDRFELPEESPERAYRRQNRTRLWVRGNRLWLMLLGIFLIALALSYFT